MMNPGDTLLPAPTAQDLSAATFSHEGANARKALKTGEHCLQVSTTDDYPWGRYEQCKRSMWLELDGIRVDKKGKRSLGNGFRVVKQTINPKTGEVCAMKTGLYTRDGVIVLYTDAATGYTERACIRFNGTEACVKAAEFLAAHPEIAQIFPAEAHEYCWAVVMDFLIANARYTPWLPGVTVEQKREALCLPSIKEAIAAKAPITALASVGINAERVNALTIR